MRVELCFHPFLFYIQAMLFGIEQFLDSHPESRHGRSYRGFIGLISSTNSQFPPDKLSVSEIPIYRGREGRGLGFALTVQLRKSHYVHISSKIRFL